MTTLINDIKYAARQLRKSPSFTLCAVLILALGIAANTALFSALDGIFFRSLTFANSKQIMSVWTRSTNPDHSHSPRMNSSLSDYRDWIEQNTVFAELAAQGYRALNLTDRDEPLALTGWAITANLFDVFEKPPVLGRSFLPEDMQVGHAKVVILSHSLWQQAFGARNDIVGQDITLDNDVYSIVGIAHPHMEYRPGDGLEFYVPLIPTPSDDNRSRRGLWVLGRLLPGVTLEQATVEMQTIAARLEAQYPDTNTSLSTLLIPLQELLFGKISSTIIILFAAAVLVLLIACANVANLLLSRAGLRSQEMSIRSALGAGRMRLLRLMLIESLLLSLVAGGLGFIGAAWAMDMLRHGVSILSQSVGIAGAARITMNPWILIFTITLSLLTSLCFGLVPAWQTSQVNPFLALRANGRGISQGRQRHWISNFLVSSEIAVAFVLLVGACLLLRSLEQLHRTSPGFDTTNLMTLEVTLPQSAAYKSDQQRAAFCRSVLDRMRNIPGVLGAASTSIPPVSGSNFSCGFTILDQGSQTPGDKPIAEHRTVSIDYFSTIGLPLQEGRLFRETDNRSNGVVIVDQEFVQRYFPDKDPIGQRIRVWEVCEIIGVVGNHQSSPNIDEPTCPHMYFPIGQSCMPFVTFMVRTHTDPLTVAEPLRQAVWAVNPDQPINQMQSMQVIVRETHSMRRLSSIILVLFAGSAVTITVIGIYGVIASVVSQRTREIGLRMAFGASPIDVVKSIMHRGLFLTGLGIVTGLAGALILCRLLSTLLYHISPVDPISYSLVIVMISVISLLACWIPARRAAKIDPMEALRYE
jgi:putative ABC transport system permease protein